MNNTFKELYEVIWKQVFAEVGVIEAEKTKVLWTKDIILPTENKCEVSGEPVWLSPEYGYKRFMTETESMKRTNEDNFMEPKSEMKNLSDVIEKVKKVAMFKGSRMVNSSVVEESDDVYSSNIVYNSAHIYSSQKIIWGHNLVQSEYLMASKGSKNCTFSIRCFDSVNVSNSFDVSFCANTSNSMFCHDCFDVRDCLFCFHLASKRFCIANVQYEEAEYNELKKKIVDEYFGQLETGKFSGLMSL